ncbi:MAG: type II toxin-antitoxin system Phd/YefM family antitoxin, partial [Opitutaceae bacterium]|nr:type II toxin-antitoxin system Phd/YefM family antitoxin [Opitutaceae bacterium]
MTTATLREFRHNFATVEKAALRGPVKITRRGRVIGTYTAARNPGKWTPPDFARRAIRTRGGMEIDVLDLLGR